MSDAPILAPFTVRALMTAVAIAAGLLGAVAWAVKTPTGREVVWLGEGALTLGILLPWTIWVGATGLVVGILAVAIDRRLWNRQTLWLFVPLLIPVMTLIFGSVFRQKSGMPDVGRPWPSGLRPSDLVGWFPWLHIPLALVLIVRHPRAWLATLGLSAAVGYWSFWSSVMAWMSVTNVWL